MQWLQASSLLPFCRSCQWIPSQILLPSLPCPPFLPDPHLLQPGLCENIILEEICPLKKNDTQINSCLKSIHESYGGRSCRFQIWCLSSGEQGGGSWHQYRETGGQPCTRRSGSQSFILTHRGGYGSRWRKVGGHLLFLNLYHSD